jgi:D-3-phosphoglycerate dehydrogenase
MADHGVNIATFHLGRNKPGGDAISLLVIDQPAR